MKTATASLLIVCAALAAASVSAATVGQPAPDFALQDTQGKTVKLSDYRGKYVVLEWTNPGCPFVRKHYDSANMPSLQREAATSKDVAWLTLNSTAASHKDHKTAEQFGVWLQEKSAAPTAALLDGDGKVGKLYGAKTTPHMFVIDPQGKLIYAGAIDDKATPDPQDVKTAKNYLKTALQEARAGKPVTTSSTTPYGCGVKYGS